MGGTFGYDEANRMVSAQEVSGGVEYFGYAADNKRILRVKTDGTEEWTFYGAQGERLGMFQVKITEVLDNSGNYAGDTFALNPVGSDIWFDGREVGWGPEDGLKSGRSGGVGYYPYGDTIAAPVQEGLQFASYMRDGYTGLDYAQQRYYASAYGRFNTADPSSENVDAANPLSWNNFSYADNDPINSTDPTGLNVSSVSLKSGPPTCYSESFKSAISSDLNGWLNSDTGTLALQVWFEFQTDSPTGGAQALWEATADVYRNRWHLSTDQKKADGFDPKAGFKQFIYSASGPKWNQPNTTQGQQSHWTPDGLLKSAERTSLINALNSSPDSGICHGIIDSFWISAEVYKDHRPDITNGAIFYVHEWYPSNPFGSNPSLANPFSLVTSPHITYVSPYVPYGSIKGTNYYVAGLFYKP